ncbi:hypothetical protein AX16_002870 [Volvariella volvacea WC 439]|nr:hypothetical protein AX16_002870 [Volvariella volvacea WC 439]
MGHHYRITTSLTVNRVGFFATKRASGIDHFTQQDPNAFNNSTSLASDIRATPHTSFEDAKLSDTFYLLYEGSEPLNEPVRQPSPFGPIAGHLEAKRHANEQLCALEDHFELDLSHFTSQISKERAYSGTYHPPAYMPPSHTSIWSQSGLPRMALYSAAWLATSSVEHPNSYCKPNPKPAHSGLKGLARLRAIAPTPLDLISNRASTAPEDVYEITVNAPVTPPDCDYDADLDTASPFTSSVGPFASHSLPKVSAERRNMATYASVVAGTTTDLGDSITSSVELGPVVLNPFDSVASLPEDMDEATRKEMIRAAPKPMPGDDMSKWISSPELSSSSSTSPSSSPVDSLSYSCTATPSYSESNANTTFAPGTHQTIPPIAEILARRIKSLTQHQDGLLNILKLGPGVLEKPVSTRAAGGRGDAGSGYKPPTPPPSPVEMVD